MADGRPALHLLSFPARGSMRHLSFVRFVCVGCAGPAPLPVEKIDAIQAPVQASTSTTSCNKCAWDKKVYRCQKSCAYQSCVSPTRPIGGEGHDTNGATRGHRMRGRAWARLFQRRRLLEPALPLHESPISLPRHVSRRNVPGRRDIRSRDAELTFGYLCA